MKTYEILSFKGQPQTSQILHLDKSTITLKHLYIRRFKVIVENKGHAILCFSIFSQVLE